MWAEKKSATKVTVATKASHSTSETIVLDATDIAKIQKDAILKRMSSELLSFIIAFSINE